MPDGVSQAVNSMYQVVNEVKDCGDESLGLKYSGNFHAKYIAGIGEESTELYLMSYNFGDIESLQFETHFLTTVETKKYNHEMQIFMEYHRLKTEKLRK